MKLTLPNRDLLSALKRTTSVVEKRSTIPVLANILLTATADALLITATDLDIAIETKVAAEVTEAGTTTVPAHLIKSIVDKLPKDGSVVLDGGVDGDDKREILSVRSGRSRFTLQTLPAGDFPALAMDDTNCQFSLDQDQVVAMFDRPNFAISTEATRYYLNGVYLHAAGSKEAPTLRSCATDGHRLAQIDTVRPDGAEAIKSGANQNGVIVSRKTVGEILSLAKDVEGMRFAISPSKIMVEAGDSKLTSKLIDGSFPDYCRVIPQGNDKLLRCNRQDLHDAIDRIATVSSERGRAVKLDLDAGKLTLSVSNPDAGTAVEELDVEWSAPAMSLGFNSHYLMDIMAEISGEAVEIKLADPGSPALLRGDDDQQALFVLMPMRV